VDAWGPVRVDQLAHEHAQQLRAVEGALMELDDLAQPARALATHVQEVVDRLRQDLVAEQENLLCPELLRDDPIIENAETD
jgi:hypothetical protein